MATDIDNVAPEDYADMCLHHQVYSRGGKKRAKKLVARFGYTGGCVSD